MNDFGAGDLGHNQELRAAAAAASAVKIIGGREIDFFHIQSVWLPGTTEPNRGSLCLPACLCCQGYSTASNGLLVVVGHDDE